MKEIITILKKKNHIAKHQGTRKRRATKQN